MRIFVPNMLCLASKTLQLALHEPGDGFYEGTRFDRGGVFASLLFRDVEMAGPWYPSYSPTMHDAVRGPAEEFSVIGFDEADPGGVFLKIGVGLLRRPDSAPYDRFRLYDIVDPGRWEVYTEGERAVFRHVLDTWYDYRKEVVLTGPGRFEIRHTLNAPVRELSGEVYNHNFFTFGRMSVGPSRWIDFPFTPDGDWRSLYDSVGFTPSGIRFSRSLQEGESVYTGNIHEAGREGMPYSLVIRETEPSPDSAACAETLSVRIEGDVPVTRTVLWASQRIACLEPYNAFRSAPGAPFRWTIRYTFQQSQ